MLRAAASTNTMLSRTTHDAKGKKEQTGLTRPIIIMYILLMFPFSRPSLRQGGLLKTPSCHDSSHRGWTLEVCLACKRTKKARAMQGPSRWSFWWAGAGEARSQWQARSAIPPTASREARQPVRPSGLLSCHHLVALFG